MITLPAPKEFKKKGKIKVWVDEAIWGHRFYNDQTPWLVLLEFLCVFRSRNLFEKALNEPRGDGAHESFKYQIPRLIPLRSLIFNNPHLHHIDASESNEGRKWSSWLSRMDNEDDFSSLRNRLEKFSRLTHIVEYFQNTSVEPHRQRRWTSRFIFPYGSDCLYADLPGDLGSPDRRFFARGGELLYLMLCRSGCGPEIAELINNSLLRDTDPWNQVAKALLSEDHLINPVESRIGYLPYPERDEYRELAHTWKQILRLDLPASGMFDPLMRLSALHMLLYMLRRSSEEVGERTEPKFVLEIAAPKKTALFELSSESLRANRMAPLRAVRAYVENSKTESGWHEALNARNPRNAILNFLEDHFAWNPDRPPPDSNPDMILSELRLDAEKRHQQHVAKVHNEWTRQIGLTVSQRGVGTWYAPSDSLLKALVICSVEGGREEYHRFLSKLYDRFRLVIAAPEAEKAFGNLPTDQHAFTLNAYRLEQRLRTLGLLRRLSDDCAYVLNPFWRTS